MKVDDHDGIVTHGRSREFRMHMKNPAQTGSGCIRFSDWKIENSPTIVLSINHHTMEWITCRGCLSINSRCLQDQPTTALHYMYIDVFNCTYSSFGCCFPLGMRCQSATIRQRRFAEYWKKKKRTSYIRWDDDVMVSTLYQTNTHSIWFYPAMTAFTDQYSLPNIFFNIGQL